MQQSNSKDPSLVLHRLSNVTTQSIVQ